MHTGLVDFNREYLERMKQSTLKFNTALEVVDIHVRTKYH